MNKIFFAKISLMLLLIFLLNKSQIVMAQTTVASADISQTTAASADVSQATGASIDVTRAPDVPAAVPINGPDSSIDKTRKIRNRFGELAYKSNFRDLKHIKWPLDHLKNDPSPDKIKNLEEIKTIHDKNCRSFAVQYSNEAEKLNEIVKDDLDLESTCDDLLIRLKNVADVQDLALQGVGAWVVREFDRELFRHYYSAIYKQNKIYKKSIFGFIRIPLKYSDITMQILIILSLGLNFFLFYKVLRER